MAARTLIDTNVLVYRYDPRFPDKRQTAITRWNRREPYVYRTNRRVATVTRGGPGGRLLELYRRTDRAVPGPLPKRRLRTLAPGSMTRFYSGTAFRRFSARMYGGDDDAAVDRRHGRRRQAPAGAGRSQRAGRAGVGDRRHPDRPLRRRDAAAAGARRAAGDPDPLRPAGPGAARARTFGRKAVPGACGGAGRPGPLCRVLHRPGGGRAFGATGRRRGPAVRKPALRRRRDGERSGLRRGTGETGRHLRQRRLFLRPPGPCLDRGRRFAAARRGRPAAGGRIAGVGRCARSAAPARRSPSSAAPRFRPRSRC